MADEADNLVLHYLPRLDEKVDQLHEDMREVKARLGRLETGQADLQVQLAEHSVRFDRLNARLDRIERRLELADPATPG
ncbi:MAG: hypothetical protein F9K29_07895 [Hyphomicrobiaceae bacterium]|nr:MAG: hypothetical protein F9K29_07895 [Hyphomicrobiaceae bacterium]